MPRLPRVYIEGSLYYITCRGAYNQVIFKENEDYEMYFGLLKKYKEQYGVKLYAYALMQTHLHLLLEVDEKTSISSVMHDLTSAYTKYFNNRYQRKGHLFRERYKAAIVEKEPQVLLNLTAYIHLNPKKLNLAITAQTYPYSSYCLYLDYNQKNERGLDIKEQISEILNSLIGENYIDFINKMEKNEGFQNLHKRLHREKVLGTDEFIKKVREKIQDQQIEEEDLSVQPQPGNKKVLSLGTALLVLAVAATGVYVYFNFIRTAPVQIEPPKQAPEQNVEKVVVEDKLMDVDKTEWEIELISPSGQVQNKDVISFNKGKFVSANLIQHKYTNTNYSLTKEGNKIIWETMQTSSQGTASWRGEIEEGQMIGMLSLRQEGQKPQDFSFRSIQYRKRK